MFSDDSPVDVEHRALGFSEEFWFVSSRGPGDPKEEGDVGVVVAAVASHGFP